MKIYLDDDIAKTLLARLLRTAGHDVQVPNDVGMTGAHDPDHLAYAIQADRVFLSQNHDDFKRLHLLLRVGRSHHPGILIVRKDDNPKRDLKSPGIVTAIRKLLAANVPIPDDFLILNNYR